MRWLEWRASDGEQVAEAGRDVRPRGVEPYSLVPAGNRSGLAEPSTNML